MTHYVMTTLTGWIRVVAAIICSLCFISFSSALILVNKYVLVDLNFPYPMFVAALGMLTTGTFCHVGVKLGYIDCKIPVSRHFFLTRIFPIGFFHSLSLWCGTYSYFLLSVSFIQMLKAFTPVVLMICLFISGIERPTRRVIFSVVLMFAGTTVEAVGEGHMSFLGLSAMLFSQVMESVRLVMTQSLLKGLDFQPLEGLYYTAPACGFWLILQSAVFEMSSFIRNNDLANFVKYRNWILICCVLGFPLNLSSYFLIKLTSSLTLKILANAKNTLLVFVGVVFLGEVVSGVQFLGYIVSLAGFIWYNFFSFKDLASYEAPVVDTREGLKGKDGGEMGVETIGGKREREWVAEGGGRREEKVEVENK